MGDFVTVAATVGVIAAGVALFEVTLIPAMAIGAAAVLAPKYVPKLRRRLRPLLNSTVRRRIEPALAPPDRPDVKVARVPPPGLRSNKRWPRPSRFRSSSRPWISPLTTLWSATSPRRRVCQPPIW